MTDRSPTASRPVTVWPTGHALDVLAVEEPLEIRVEGRPLAITLRTPGHDLELAAGFLLTEGVIDGRDDLVALRHVDPPSDPRGNTVDAVLAGGVEAHRAALDRATRELYATSSCGLCGKASIDRLRTRFPPLRSRLDPPTELLRSLAEPFDRALPGFAATGGLHGAALVDLDGRFEVAREDVGRHNAVDKVLGWRLLADRVPVDDRVLVVSSRIGFEIVQKARAAQVSAVVAMGAASTLAVDLATDAGITLVGFLRSDRFVRYA